MDKQLMIELNKKFEDSSYEQDGVEYNSHQLISHHFVEVNKTMRKTNRKYLPEPQREK